VYGFDYTNDLATGDTISSVSSVSLTVQTGTDSNPSSHLVGSPSIVTPVVTQRISGLLAGVTYILQIVVNTTQGDTLSDWSRIPCRPVY